MELQSKTEQAKENLWKAIDDYKAHTYSKHILDSITDSFVDTLAEDSTRAKEELRNLFRKSPAWDEELDALVINGTRTHDPDYDRAHALAESILAPAHRSSDHETNEKISRALRFFTRPKISETERRESIAAIKALAPHAYAPGKKHSRIFLALCDALGVSDKKSGSFFQRQYAKFADEISSRKIPCKLYVSINPAHFLTMSNPKDDGRGDMMTSCHSLNSTEHPYNCGCTGYARDRYTFIVFTVSDPKNPETLNNRKTSRQIFAYRPKNGLLLQSRFYNTAGGTYGAQEDSKLYRDLIQREISFLEDAANLWKTQDYYGNPLCTIPAGQGFGGYQDWTYKDFAAKISVRDDHAKDFQTFEVGTSGLCLCCGERICSGLYCGSCEEDADDDESYEDEYEDGANEETCDRCGSSCDETYPVRDAADMLVYVCAQCRDERYTLCELCNEHYPNETVTALSDGRRVCHRCAGELLGRDAA